MKKFAIFLLFIIANSNKAMEKENTYIGPIEGEFTIDTRFAATYAGYGEKSYGNLDPVEQCTKQFNRKIEPNELLFKIIASLVIKETQQNSQNLRRHQVKAWQKSGLSSYIPYKEVKDLDEKSTLNLLSPKGQSVNLMVNTKKFTEEAQATFQKNLNKVITHTKKNAEYFLSDEKKLAETGILKSQEVVRYGEKKIEYIHGPNGFDFSILESKDNN